MVVVPAYPKWLGIHEFLVRSAKGMAFLGALGLLFAGAGVVLDVFSRWVFNAPIMGVQDVNRYAMALAISSFFPLCLIYRENVAVTFLGSLLGARISLWLNGFANLVVLIAVAVLTYSLGAYAHHALEQDLRTMTLELPQAPWWICAAVVFATALPMQLWITILAIRSAMANKDFLARLSVPTDRTARNK